MKTWWLGLVSLSLALSGTAHAEVIELGSWTMHLAYLPKRASVHGISSVTVGESPSRAHPSGTVFVAVASSPVVVIEWDLVHDREVRRVPLPVKGASIATAALRTDDGLVVATANDAEGLVRVTHLGADLRVASAEVLGHGDAVALADDPAKRAFVAWRDGGAAHLAPVASRGAAWTTTTFTDLPTYAPPQDPTWPLHARSVELAFASDVGMLIVDAHTVVMLRGSTETQRFPYGGDAHVEREGASLVLYNSFGRVRVAPPALLPMFSPYDLGVGYLAHAVRSEDGELIYTCGGGIGSTDGGSGGPLVIPRGFTLEDRGECMGATWAFGGPLSIDGASGSGAERILWFKPNF